MNRSNFRKYMAYVKEQKQASIEDYYIEKDYFLSLFLSAWQRLKEEGKTPHLDTLIFKGGTLLGRNILQYSRISEELGKPVINFKTKSSGAYAFVVLDENIHYAFILGDN